MRTAVPARAIQRMYGTPELVTMMLGPWSPVALSCTFANVSTVAIADQVPPGGRLLYLIDGCTWSSLSQDRCNVPSGPNASCGCTGVPPSKTICGALQVPPLRCR